MKLKRNLTITGLLLVLTVVLGISIYAALTDTKEKGPIIFEFGDLSFTVDGEIDENYIFPGKNIVKQTYKITNNSNINTELRIKVSFYIKEQWYEVNDFEDYTEEFDFDEDNNFILNSDGFYYYNNGTDGTLAPEVTSLTLFTILMLDGFVVKNQVESKDFKIKITLHAKQKDNVDWTTLGDVFS